MSCPDFMFQSEIRKIKINLSMVKFVGHYSYQPYLEKNLQLCVSIVFYWSSGDHIPPVCCNGQLSHAALLF